MYKQKIMLLKEVKSGAEIESGAMRIFSTDFETIKIEDIPNRIDAINQWQPYGYNKIILHRSCQSIYLYKV